MSKAKQRVSESSQSEEVVKQRDEHSESEDRPRCSVFVRSRTSKRRKLKSDEQNSANIHRGYSSSSNKSMIMAESSDNSTDNLSMMHICETSVCYGSTDWHSHPESVFSDSLKFSDQTQSDFVIYNRWRDTIPWMYDQLTVYSMPQPSHSVHFVRNINDDRLLISSQCSALVGQADQTDTSIHLDSNVELKPTTYLQNLLIRRPDRSDDSMKSIQHGCAVESMYQVSKIRAMPQKPHLIATRVNSSEIAVYWMDMDTVFETHSNYQNNTTLEYLKNESKLNWTDKDYSIFHGAIDLNYNTEVVCVLFPKRKKSKNASDKSSMGYSMSWSEECSGLIISGDIHGIIREHQLDHDCDRVPQVTAHHSECTITQKTRISDHWPDIAPNATYQSSVPNSPEITAVEFAPQSSALFASANAEGLLSLWDRRVGKCSTPVRRCRAGFTDSAIYSLDWNRHCIGQLATGDGTGRVRVWDIRNLKKHLSEIQQHASTVSCVKFCPYNPHLLASSGIDELVCIYDTTIPSISNDDSEMKKAAWANRLSPTVFVHSGHCASVTEFDWAPNRRDFTIASTDLSGLIHVWTPVQGIIQS